MSKFKLVSGFQPTGDQPEAIRKLAEGIERDKKEQVLLGVTGSGKTFSIANVIENLQLPTLVISHNKTLAGQLYQEFRDFFPENAVSYFVSYYDYYQPEAYIARTDTYIEKETDINDEIDKLRLRATSNLLTREDTLVVASVSSIYNIGSAKEYGNYVLEVKIGTNLRMDKVLENLVNLQYSRSGFDFVRGTFRLRGDNIDIYPAYSDTAVRLVTENNKLIEIFELDPLSGNKTGNMDALVIYPAKHYMMNPKKMENAIREIREDLEIQAREFTKQNKYIEAQRITQRVNYDLEMIKEIGYVNGIENYSRYFDGRKAGEAPYTLIDYYWHKFGSEWLLVIDESHMTIPQIRGMFTGDAARKKTLVEYGFRLPSAMDNRPLRFDEFLRRLPYTIYLSATPSEWERKKSAQIVEQLIRPTGLIDPDVEIRSSKGQIPDLIKEIMLRKVKGERTLVTTLTKKTAEDLTQFLNSKKELLNLVGNIKSIDLPKVQYLHSDVNTLDRQDILDELRGGKFDVLVGINLLREGLDLPEVSLVAILDADKEGFLRSDTSLIQTMGRAARHINGKVIMYAEVKTGSMIRAIAEVRRRRKVQLNYNYINRIKPEGITKPIRQKLIKRQDKETKKSGNKEHDLLFDGKPVYEIDRDELIPADKKKLIKNLQKEMKKAAGELNFEKAARLRDKINSISA